MNRRHFLSTLGVATATVALPGCSSTGEPTTASSTPASSGGSFPATVTHRYGSTTVPSAPQRILTLGQTDHDAVIALGLKPIAVAGFLGSTYTPFRPWNSAGMVTRPPVLDMMEIQFEKVAELAPDLILSVMSGLTRADYTKLSAIAPTVAQPVDYEDWAVPYQPHTRHIGAALGSSEVADRLVSDLEAAFLAVRSEHPVLVGKRTACAELNAGEFAVLGTAAPRTQFLTDVGMTLSAPLTALVGKAYNAPLSNEKVDMLEDLDVVVWTTDTAEVPALLANKLVRALSSTEEGRYLLAPNGGDDNLLYSMDWGSISSNRWAIENAVPRLVRAADGDVGTDANTP